MFWLILGSRPCRSFAGQLWQDFRRLSRYLSKLDEKRKLQKTAKSSTRKRGLVYMQTPNLCSASSHLRNRKHQLSSLGTTTWWNIASMSADSFIWCSRKQKDPIRLCNRSGPEKTLSFRASLWHVASALHTLLTFSSLHRLLTGWCGKHHWSLPLVLFTSTLQT